MKCKDLTKYFDKGIWITDDRVATYISNTSKSIEQIDYHGKQPVSKNSRVFMNKNGVFKFLIHFKYLETNYTYKVDFSKVIWSPNKIKNTFQICNIDFQLSIITINKSLIFLLELCNRNTASVEINFAINWNDKSPTLEVQGNREWKEIQINNNTLSICATDRILIKEWLKRKGDYQGDFLIPEVFRRMIFKTEKISGQATYDDLKDEYKTNDMLLYDAGLFCIMGATDYYVNKSDNSTEFIAKRNVHQQESLAFNPFIISFGEDQNDVNSLFYRTTSNFRELILGRDNRYINLQKSLPKLNSNGFDCINDLLEIIPQIIESAEIQDFQMIRACSSSYYWLWAWDSMVTATELSKWNNLKLQKSIIDFIRINRDIDGSIPQQWSRSIEPMDNRDFGVHDFLFSLLVMSHYYSTSDLEVIKENYPQIIYSFEQIYTSCYDHGFFPTIGMYPDFPLKLGRENDGFTTMDELSLFSLAILIQHSAYLMNDSFNIERSEELIHKLKINILQHFYDFDKGFFVDSVSKDLIRNPSYPLYSLLFILYPTAIALIRDYLEDIAGFINENHFEENGIALMPKWDKNRLTESAMPSWYPFWDIIAIKLFRRTNNITAIKKWLNLVQRCYLYFGFCPEFVSLEPQKMDGNNWKARGTPWNLNCSAGWYHSIIEGIFGIEEDIGGITYIPTEPIASNLKLSGIYIRGIKTDIEIIGNGDYVNDFMVNGEKLIGSLKIPQKYFNSQEITIIITHSTDAPDLLVKEMNGAAIISVKKSENMISIEFEGFGFVEIVFMACKKPESLLDGDEIPIKWSDFKKSGSITSTLFGNHKLILKILN